MEEGNQQTNFKSLTINKRACFAGYKQNLPGVTQPRGQIKPFSYTAVTFASMMQFDVIWNLYFPNQEQHYPF